MKLFISWSGEEAKAIGLELQHWLPLVNRDFEVFVSSESIGAGKRWFEILQTELSSSNCGIGIFTKQNLRSTWLFFEHGAIATKNEFIPLLCGCELKDLDETPATHFQARIFDQEPFLKLVRELNKKCEILHSTARVLSEEELSRLFTKIWPDINDKINSILNQAEIKRSEASKKDQTFLELQPQVADQAIARTIKIDILSSFSDIELQKIFHDATTRIDCLVLSARNLFSPAVSETLRKRIQDSTLSCKVRILAMDTYSDGHFFDRRKEMMESGAKNNYARDMEAAREYAKNLADLDQEHKKFDVRFYSLMPTQFYFIVDNFLYLSFVLSTPVARCPMLKFDLSIHKDMDLTFSKHFEHYWNSCRYFVSIVGFKEDGAFLMVKNRKREWEWPGGFIEPKEDPLSSAMREFREESGYDIVDVREIRREANGGTFYAGRLGQKQAEISAREMEKLDFFEDLPPENKLSFPMERATFIDVIKDARAQLNII